MSIYVSASSIKDYLSCPRKVYFRIYEPDAKEDNRAILMGNIAHRIAEEQWKSKDGAYNALEIMAKSNGLTKKEVQTQQRFINNFFGHFIPLLDSGDEVEKMFKVNLYDDVYLVGKIDRISNGNLFDWKTSTRVPSNLSNNPQFIVYKYAYTKLYGEEPNSLYLGGLSTGELVPYVAEPFYEDILFSDVVPNLVHSIRIGKFPRYGIFNKSCYRCLFSTACLGLGDNDVVDSSDSFA